MSDDPRGDGRETLYEGAGEPGPSTGPVLGPGDSLAGYLLQEVVGAGGMGVVFRAHDKELGRFVAVKVIAPELASNPTFRELFLRESRAAAEVEHPHVLPVYRAGESDGHLYVAMRLVRGPSLRALIEAEGALAPARATRLAAQVASALDAAHARGLVHRDVKPGNILVSQVGDEEHAYLADFGLVGSERAGTPEYMSPERLSGDVGGVPSDIYALGRVLIACLSGDPHAKTGAPIDPGLPAGFSETVARAVAEQAEERFPTAGAFASALGELRHDTVVLASPRNASNANLIRAALVQGGVSLPGDGAEAVTSLGLASGCIVLLGPDGLGDWAREPLAEVERISDRDRQFRQLAVFCPGAPAPSDPEVAFLSSWRSVDLRDGLEDASSALRRAILGPTLGRVGPESDVCPYQGLAAFEEDDASRFIGREEDVARLVDLLRASRFVAVLGPSGSGKSSFLRAGLVPALRGGALAGSGNWPVAIVRPGTDPLGAIANAVAGFGGSLAEVDIARDPTSVDRALEPLRVDRAVLIVDQFEEIFTLCSDPARRRGVIDALAYAATIPSGRLVLILGMRADFYGRLAEHDVLRTLSAEHQYLVGPMDARALRRAIEEPAAHAGLTLEPGLARTLVEDVDDRPGALPLLSHALYELWRRRRGGELTLEAYAASGGVDGALAKRAEEVFQHLEPDEQRAARQALLRMVQPGEGTEDTRRKALMRDLGTHAAHGAVVEPVISALADARLVTTSRDEAGNASVEIAHEALVRSWPRLREWIDHDREGIRLRLRLAESTADWIRSDRDDSLLLRGSQLQAWGERDVSDSSETEAEFLDASTRYADRLNAARRRRTRATVASLAGGLVVVGSLAGVAFVQRNTVSSERDRALSRQIAASAREQLGVDPELSHLLARRAFEVDDTREAEEILRQSAFNSRLREAYLAGPGIVPTDVALLTDAIAATSASDGTLRLWNTADGREIRSLSGHKGSTNRLAVISEGDVLTVGDDATMRRWNVTTGNGRIVVELGGPATAVDFGAGVAVAGTRTGSVVRVTLGESRRQVVGRMSAAIVSVAISPDGSTIVAGDVRGEVRSWVNGEERILRRADDAAAVEALDISPDGRDLLVATAFLLRVQSLDGRASRERGGLSASFARFDRSGRFVAVGSAPGQIRVLRARDLRELSVMRGAKGAVRSLAFDLSGRRLISASDDGRTRVWDWEGAASRTAVVSGDEYIPQGQPRRRGRSVLVVLGSGRIGTWTSPADSVVSSGDKLAQPVAGYGIDEAGRLAAIGLVDGTIVLRDIDSLQDSVLAKGTGVFDNKTFVKWLAVGKDGRRLAGGIGPDLWTLDRDKGAPTRVASGHPVLTSLALSPDESLVATGGDDGTLRVWDFGARTPIREVHDPGSAVLATAFSPDGELVASGGTDRTVRVRALDGTVRAQLRGLSSDVNWVGFAKDGARLSVATNDELFLWDWKRDVILTRLPVAEETYAVTLGPDDRVLSFGAADASVLRDWLCPTCGSLDDAKATGGLRITRDLSDTERASFQTGE